MNDSCKKRIKKTTLVMILEITLFCVLIFAGSQVFARYTSSFDTQRFSLGILAGYRLHFDTDGGTLTYPLEDDDTWKNVTATTADKRINNGEAYGVLPTVVREGYTFDGWLTKTALPAGYTGVEFIEGTGTQYIETGYIPKLHTFGFIADCVFYDDLSSGTKSLMTAYDSWASGKVCFGIGGNFNAIGGHCYGWRGIRIEPGTLTAGERGVVSFINNGDFNPDTKKSTMTITAPEYAQPVTETITGEADEGIKNSMAVFAGKNNGTVSEICHAAFYGLQYLECDEVVLDFVPAVWGGGKTTYSCKGEKHTDAELEAGTAGFYETKHNVFYINSGDKTKGDFTTGPISSGRITPEDIFIQAEDLNIVPVWTARDVTITFDLNDDDGGSTRATGNIPGGKLTLKYDDSLEQMPHPARTGYTLLGWYDSEDNRYDWTDKAKFPETVTLYAHWQANTYTVTFNTGTDEVIEPKTVAFDSTYGEMASPSRTNYIFKGWRTQPVPKGYKFVEYLESDGTQYINTRYHPHQNTFGFYADYVFYNDLSNTRTVMGVYDNWSDNSPCFSIGGNYLNGYGSYWTGWKAGGKLSGCCTTPGERGYISIKNNGDYDENTHKSTITVQSTNYNPAEPDIIIGAGTTGHWLMVFGCNSAAGAIEIPHARFYSLKFYEVDQLIRDYRPAVWNGGITKYSKGEHVITGSLPAGTSGFYDLCEGIFYINSNTAATEDFTVPEDPIDTRVTENTPVHALTDHTLYAEWEAVSPTLLPATSFQSELKKLNSNILNTATAMTRVYELPENAHPETEAGFVNAAVKGELPVWVWLDGTALKYYCEADRIYLNTSSTGLLKDFVVITSIDTTGWDTSKVTSFDRLIAHCRLLTEFDVSKWDTSNVTSWEYGFFDCPAITKLDMSGWSTKKLTTIANAFGGDSKLSDLKLPSENGAFASLKKMESAFSGCGLVPAFDFSNCDLGQLGTAAGAFNNCSGAETIKFPAEFNASKITNFESMFNGCSSLKSVNTESWTTDSATSTYRMFNGCSSLAQIDVSGFNMSKVTNAAYMFGDCKKLESIDVSAWDNNCVTTMAGMFYDCFLIKEVDLSGFSSSALTSANRMFAHCTSLETIYVSDGLSDISNVKDGDAMMADCPKIVGGNGTKFDSSKTKSDYAKADYAGSKGYFTYGGSHAEDVVIITYDVNTAEVSPVTFTQQIKAGQSYTIGGAENQISERYGHILLGFSTEESAEEYIATGTVMETEITDRIILDYSYWAGPVCMTAREAGTTVELCKVGAPNAINIEYSVDEEKTWSTLAICSTVSSHDGDKILLANAGDKVYFRAVGKNARLGKSVNNTYTFNLTGEADVSGNIMTLLDSSAQQTELSKNSHIFRQLFENCTALISAEDLLLPAKTITESGYAYMFHGCTNLTGVPELPATTLAASCYENMFKECSNLKRLEVSFTEWNEAATATWVNGVQTKEGVFVCPEELEETHGTSAIPVNWTVERATPPAALTLNYNHDDAPEQVVHALTEQPQE